MGEISSEPKYEHIDLRDNYFYWGVYDGGYYWEDRVQPGGTLAHLIDGQDKFIEKTGKLIDLIAEGYGVPEEIIEQLRQATGFYSDQVIAMHKIYEEYQPKLEDILSCYPQFSEGPFLLEKPGGHFYNMINPLEKRTDLFLEFASLNLTRQAILGFANKYGLLRQKAVELVSTDDSLSASDIKKRFCLLDLTEENAFHVYGEPLDFWQPAIRRMKWTVALWELLKEEDEQALRRVIHWTKKGDKISYILADEEILDRYSTAAEVMAAAKKSGFPHIVDDLISKKETIQKLKLKPGDVLLPAKLVIQKRINLELSVPDFGHRQNNIQLYLLLEEDNSLVSSFEPKDLLTAMWLQFYFTASGHYKFKRCVECRDWADISNSSKNWTMHPACANRKRVREFRAQKAEKKPAKKPAAKKAAKQGKK